MLMKRITKIILVSVILLGVIGVAVISSNALAKEQTQTINVNVCGSEFLGGKHVGSGLRGGMFSQSGLDAAAKLLGITVDELQTQLRAGANLADLADDSGVDLQTLRDAVESAQKAELKNELQQSVSDGDLTQAEADWMIKGIDAGYSQGFGKGKLSSQTNSQDVGLSAAADKLGIEIQDLSNQLWAGRALSEISEKAGVELQTVIDATDQACQDAVTQQIQQAVANGQITQEQADWMLEGLKNGYGKFGQEKGLGVGFGLEEGGRGHGGMRGSHP
jgi:hypothetical protein